MKSAKAMLVLEDGTVFEGAPFAGSGRTVGETVFYTGVVGYQEVLTDPSYAGTLVVLTYPIIGSYGVNGEDNETADVHVAGVVIREYSRHISNFRATGKLEDFLVERAVVGIQGVDTRAVAIHLREHGEMKGMIVSGGGDPRKLAEELKETPPAWQADLVKELGMPEVPPAQGAAKHRLLALSIGMKRSWLEQLARLGCAVEMVPAAAEVKDILRSGAKGIVLAGGPGDPHVPEYAASAVKALLGRTPILGVGLGHQLLALSLGCGVTRMKTGHHGVNYPVRRTQDGVLEITTQAHSFVVDEKSVPGGVTVTHVNVNDRTIEGIRSEKFPALSVQFSPCPDEMGNPNRVFAEFVGSLY